MKNGKEVFVIKSIRESGTCKNRIRFLQSFSTRLIKAYNPIAIIHKSTIDMSSQSILKT